jgi:hypothetical protein
VLKGSDGAMQQARHLASDEAMTLRMKGSAQD